MGSRAQSRGRSRDIDGGWAWVVLLGAVVCTFIHVGSLRSFGVLHIELLELYGESDARTGLVSFTLNLVATCVALPAGLLADRYSPRIIVVLGALMAALGIGLTAVAPSLDVTILTMGAITGFGIEFVAVATIITLNKYFCKRRALANGVAMAGASLGNLVIPPVLEVVVQRYAFRGTILILCGVWAHLVLVGAVLRPITVQAQGDDENSDKKEPVDGDMEEVKALSEKGDVVNQDAADGGKSGAVTDKEDEDDEALDRPALGTLFQKGHVIMGSVHSLTTLPRVEEERVTGAESREVRDPSPARPVCCRCNNAAHNNEICALLRTPSILQIGFMVAMGCLAIFTGLYTLPLLAHEIGETKFRGSLLLSVAGACDLVSRVVLGLVSDLPRVSKPLVVKLSFLLSGVLGLVLCSFHNFASLSALSVVLGCLGSNHMLLLGPILMDTVGAQRLGTAMGLVSIPMGLATAIGPPLLGGVKAGTGTYFAAARVLSVCFILGFLVYFVDSDLINACRTRFSKSRQMKAGNIPQESHDDNEVSKPAQPAANQQLTV